ncbi:MAG: sigma-70 family RNA polymerase sigma factor [Candidatus Peribacteraceae bacterium]|jgi:RNA polymerase sigma-70 factor (ECF subfamily)
MSTPATDPSRPLSVADEAALIHTCQQGDLEAFAPLYDAYVTPIYRYVHFRTFDKQLAEDVTSQSFLKAMEGIRTFNAHKGNFGAWLYRIARNTLTDHFRAHKPTDVIDETFDVPADDDTAKEASIDVSLAHVRKELDKLDPLKRDIILMRLWDGLSYREIAEITGKTENNCKVIFCRTLESLRSQLGPTLLFLLLAFPIFHVSK